jgi:hypothetical protein
MAVMKLAGIATLTFAMTWSAFSHAQDDMKQRCGRAYSASQEQRLEKNLIEARAQLLICMADECPEVARKDCAKWLDEVEAAIPSVVFRFVDSSGAERNDVSVTMDGKALVGSLEGTAVKIDPGPHVFVLRAAGLAPVERALTITEGEQLRKIEVVLDPPASADTPLPRARPDEEATVHPMAWVLYGVSALGVGGFIGLGIHSINLEDCADTCSDDDVDGIVVTRAIADVTLGVGVLALAGAIWITVASLDNDDGADAASLRLAVISTPGGPVPGATLSF